MGVDSIHSILSCHSVTKYNTFVASPISTFDNCPAMTYKPRLQTTSDS